MRIFEVRFSLSHQDSKTEYRQEVETPLRTLPSSSTGKLAVTLLRQLRMQTQQEIWTPS